MASYVISTSRTRFLFGLQWQIIKDLEWNEASLKMILCQQGLPPRELESVRENLARWLGGSGNELDQPKIGPGAIGVSVSRGKWLANTTTDLLRSVSVVLTQGAPVWRLISNQMVVHFTSLMLGVIF